MSDAARELPLEPPSPPAPAEPGRALTRFHQRLIAESLTARSADSTERVAGALLEAKVDLNPHQVEAAAFALESLDRGGCMLADEVGLGKTIEAGIVLAQLMAEGRSRLLILCPATLRAQWQAELKEKFDLDSVLVDGRTVRATGNCFDQPAPVIASIPFGANRAELLSQIPWDLVVIDEAHRLRNAHRPNNKTGRALKAALRDRPKVLLTATPLQNDLSELFGLLSLLDEQILGPEHAFKARYTADATDGSLPDGAAVELKERLSPVVHRTLRRQVREYVRFTHRRSLVEDFAPSAQEQSLYERVSEYLRRAEALAIEPGKKTLLTLVYRKLLASSTYAIAPTLRRLADSLERRLDAAKLHAEGSKLLFEPDEAKQFTEEAEEWSDEPSRPATLKALRDELFELQSYAEQAEAISVNAKGEALKRALDRTFTVARAHQWPEKAVIFTESKRTQDYLFQLLAQHGYEGKISRLSGDAGTPEERRALVDEFRHRTQILLSTEAGAEGLNLQFCNLVVNYDLPWNPQRLEQRIGRCHRYGQERDVLVLNFLNRQNAADARLYELLEKKLNLFDGVFGASDEILGALESGVDFERRVLDIYQSCRTREEVDAAFDSLRGELDKRINQRMTQARTLLLERFDGDVRRRLRLRGAEASNAIERRRKEARALAGAVLGAKETNRRKVAEAMGKAKCLPQDAVSYLELDASSLPSRLTGLAGKDGWWFAYRFEVKGLKTEERLAHVVLLRDGEGYRALPLEDGEAIFQLPAREESQRKPPPLSVAKAQEQAVQAARDELQRKMERQAAVELDMARERADRYAEDCLLEPRQQLHEAHEAWQAGRRALASLAADAPERAKARAQVERLEREHRRKLTALRMAEEKAYADKDRSLAALAQRAKVVIGRQLIATAYIWVA